MIVDHLVVCQVFSSTHLCMLALGGLTMRCARAVHTLCERSATVDPFPPM